MDRHHDSGTGWDLCEWGHLTQRVIYRVITDQYGRVDLLDQVDAVQLHPDQMQGWIEWYRDTVAIYVKRRQRCSGWV